MDLVKAWVVAETGRLPRITEKRLGHPGPGEVRLRVTATGLNFADLLMIEGKYQDSPPVPFVPGMEVAGVVEARGDDIEGVIQGQRVAAFVGSGGLATGAIVPAASLRPIPDSMDDVTAAGFQIAYGTSHLALTRRARLVAGETLVVLGAAGGVGLTAVEIGRRLGARVIAVARGKAKLDVAREAGADILIDGGEDDLSSRLREAGPADVVYDAVGGAVGEAALRALAPEGRFLVIGFASGTLPCLKPNHLLVKNQTVIGVYWGGYMKFRPDVLMASLDELTDWHARGLIKPHVSHVLPFEKALEGLELLRSRQAIGKVVITP